MLDIVSIISLSITPITSVVTWIVARRARNNDMLVQMQNTIDMLVDKNKCLYEEVVNLRAEVARLNAMM